MRCSRKEHKRQRRACQGDLCHLIHATVGTELRAAGRYRKSVTNLEWSESNQDSENPGIVTTFRIIRVRKGVTGLEWPESKY